MTGASGDVTILLQRIRSGQPGAEAQLLALIYSELKKLASAHLRQERADHTLQPADLVHEAFLRMAGTGMPWQNRAHFFGVAAQVMRRILVDHARARSAQKRGDGRRKVSLDDISAMSAADAQHVIDLDYALSRLAAIDARQAKIVELRFFTGLSIRETAEALGCGDRTVNREWRTAQAWLRRELSSGEHP